MNNTNFQEQSTWGAAEPLEALHQVAGHHSLHGLGHLRDEASLHGLGRPREVADRHGLEPLGQSPWAR